MKYILQTILLFSFTLSAIAQDCGELKKTIENRESQIKELINTNSILEKKNYELDLINANLTTENAILKNRIVHYERKVKTGETEVSKLKAYYKKTTDSLRAVVETKLLIIDSLRKANSNLNTLNEALHEANRALKALNKSYEENAILDSIEIAKLKKELYRKSLRAINFSVSKEKKINGAINIQFDLIDYQGIAANDTLLIVVELYHTPEKNNAVVSNEDGTIKIGASGTSHARDKITGKTDVSSQPVYFTFTQNGAFTNKNIQNNNYQIRVFYQDEENKKVLLGTYLITKKNLIIK